MKRLLIALAACGATPTGPTNVVPTVTAPSCVASSDITGVEPGSDPTACYLVPRSNGDQECWRLDAASRTWRFVDRKHRVDELGPGPVTATLTTATVCKPNHTDCKHVPISGIVLEPEETPSAATNADRSLVAAWTMSGVTVFDIAGNRLSKIEPWLTAMSADGDPAQFREVHVLGNVVEVRIADTPISSAIRLYDARSGAQIADVYGAKPMNDTSAPASLGGTIYAFLSIDRVLVVVDVATGRQLATYSVGGSDVSLSVIRGTPSRIAAIIGAAGFVIERGTVSSVPAPVCPP